ncbi:heavy metal-responsive transcriptional regulator [Streptomyces lavendulocolor]|uniref:Heavy metal-responsive transcriptional regulator n=1 Tax=Streptomyces lavendulocolor TaxID=67316 RepID=A0ABV2W2A7_9ACTN|nr:Cu(I)-responsive transcriptional regulator [Streptomyces cellulosae]
MTTADQHLYTVSQAAQQAGVTRKAIRTWENKGLLPPAERTEAGYRLFTADDIAVLRFIRQAKTLGLTLAEVGDILALQRDGAQPCGRVTQLLDAHIDQIDRTLTELRQLRKALVTARRTADQARRAGGDAVVCQIIETSPGR